MSKEFFAKADKPPTPTGLATVDYNASSKQRCFLGTLFSSTTTAAPYDYKKDEGAAQRHEEDLPPLQGSTFGDGGWGAEAANRWKGC